MGGKHQQLEMEREEKGRAEELERKRLEEDTRKRTAAEQHKLREREEQNRRREEEEKHRLEEMERRRVELERKLRIEKEEMQELRRKCMMLEEGTRSPSLGPPPHRYRLADWSFPPTTNPNREQKDTGAVMVSLELHTVGPHSGTDPCPPPSCGHLVGLLTVCVCVCMCGLSITHRCQRAGACRRGYGDRPHRRVHLFISLRVRWAQP